MRYPQFCPRCGYQAPEDKEFCPHCRCRLKHISEVDHGFSTDMPVKDQLEVLEETYRSGSIGREKYLEIRSSITAKGSYEWKGETGGGRKVDKCPRCGSARFIRYKGHYIKCKDCGKIIYLGRD